MLVKFFWACSLAKAYIGFDYVSIDISFYFNLNDNIELVIKLLFTFYQSWAAHLTHTTKSLSNLQM